MKNKGICIVVWIFLLFIVSSLFAKPDNSIVMIGDNIEYNREAGIIIASGNLFVKYKGYLMRSQAFHYNLQDQFIEIPSNLDIYKPNQQVNMNDFKYDLSKEHGCADQLQIKVKKVFIKGDVIQFKPDKLEIKNATFTTCDLAEPHYYIKSERIEMFPNQGFFVAHNNMFHHYVLPFNIWIPTSYGAAAPIPNIGSNLLEGAYVRQGFSYFFNPDSKGTLDLGYAEKLGSLFGFTHQFKFWENQQTDLRFHTAGNDGLEGGLDHHIYLGEPKQTEDSENRFFSKMMQLNQFAPGRVSLMVKHREIIDDSRVSFLPLIEGEMNRLNLFNSDVFITAIMNAGKVREETIDQGTNQANKIHLESDIEKEWELFNYYYFTWRNQFYGNYYSNQQRWIRLFSEFQFHWNAYGFRPEVSFAKKLMNTGESPFYYEKRYAKIGDEIGFMITKRYGNTELELEIDYNIEINEFRNLDFICRYFFHCWGIDFRWNTVHKEFNFGVILN